MKLVSGKRDRTGKKGRSGMRLIQRARAALGCVLGCSYTSTLKMEQSVVVRPRGWMGNKRRISRKPNRSQGFLLAMDMAGLQSSDGAAVA